MKPFRAVFLHLFLSLYILYGIWPGVTVDLIAINVYFLRCQEASDLARARAITSEGKRWGNWSGRVSNRWEVSRYIVYYRLQRMTYFPKKESRVCLLKSNSRVILYLFCIFGDILQSGLIQFNLIEPTILQLEKFCLRKHDHILSGVFILLGDLLSTRKLLSYDICYCQRLMSRWRYQFSYDHWSQASWAQPVFRRAKLSGEWGVLL